MSFKDGDQGEGGAPLGQMPSGLFSVKLGGQNFTIMMS